MKRRGAAHAWRKRKAITTDDLGSETVLLLGTGHSFRDQLTEACHVSHAG